MEVERPPRTRRERLRDRRNDAMIPLSTLARAFAAKHGVTFPDPCGTCAGRGYLRGADGRPLYCSCGWGAKARTRDARDDAEMRATIYTNRRAALARTLILPARFASYTLADHPCATPGARGHEDFLDILDWLRAFDGKRGLVIMGAYGVGKTTALAGILNALREERAITRGWGMRYTTTLDLLNTLQSGYDDHSYLSTLDEFSTVSVLALDDLGAERTRDWRQEQYLAILGSRYDAGLPLIATTNLMKDADFVAALGERVYWRLRETCLWVTLRGRNLRDGK